MHPSSRVRVQTQYQVSLSSSTTSDIPREVYFLKNRTVSTAAPSTNSLRGRTQKKQIRRDTPTKDRIFQLGVQTIYVDTSIEKSMRTIPLFSLPQTLITEIQMLIEKHREKYLQMSIIQLIFFCALEAAKQPVQLILEEKPFVDIHDKIFNTQKNLRNNCPCHDDIANLQLYIDHFRSVNNEELVPFLIEMQSHIKNLLKSQSRVQLDQKLAQAWSMPAQQFDGRFLLEKYDQRPLEVRAKDMALPICLLPSIASDIGITLTAVLLRTQVTHKSIQTTFNTLMTSVEAMVANTHLPSHIQQESVEIVKRLINDNLKYVNLMEAVYMVELEECADTFSQSYCHRLFNDSNPAETRDFIRNHIEELDELSQRVTLFCQKMYELNNKFCTDLYGFIIYPIFICQESTKLQPTITLEAFKNYYNNKIIESQGNFDFFLDHMSRDFLRTYPTLSPPFTLLKRLIDDCRKTMSSFARHSAATRDFIHSALGESISNIKTIVLKELREKEANHLAEMQRLEWEQTLFASEETTVARTRNRKQKKAITSIELPSSEVNDTSTLAITSPFTEQLSTDDSLEASSSLSVPLEEQRILFASFEDMFRTMRAYQLTNSFAKQSWNNAIDQYNDLRAELQVLPNLMESGEVADHLSRILVISSLLMEQVLSAHLLEENHPTDRYACWQLLRHDFQYLLEMSGLNKRSNEISSLTKAFSNLDSLSRSIYTAPHRKSHGAQLLYQIEELLTSKDLTQIEPLMSKVHALTRELLTCLNHLIHPEKKIDFPSLEEMRQQKSAIEEELPLRPEEELPLHPLVDKIHIALSMFQVPLLDICQPEIGSPNHHLADAKRLLQLLEWRLKRGVEGGNARNFYKILNTYLPLAIESVAKAGATLRGKLDWTSTTHAQLSHNLMEWFEKLEIRGLTPEMIDYLHSSSNMLKFNRSSRLYSSTPQQHVDQKFLKDIHSVNRSMIADLPLSHEGWIMAGQKEKNLQRIVWDAEKKANIGLGLLRKIVEDIFTPAAILSPASSSS